jgi:hypothetical protein
MSQNSRTLRAGAAALLLALGVAACGSNATPSPSALVGPSASVAAGATASPSGPVGSPNPSVPAASNGPIASAPIDDITCDAKTHVGGVTGKVSLTLNVGSTTVLPTANIGVLATCKYWVYSDAQGGLIIDAPANKQVTLGSFITIWQRTKPNDPAFNQFVIAMSGPSKTITVDGKPVNGDKWQNMPITDGMKIVASTSAAPTNAPVASPTPATSASPAPSPSAS